MIRLGIINSNYVTISRGTKKGTEIFSYILIRQLSRQAKRYNLHMTAFASGDSELPVKLVSVNHKSSMKDADIGERHHKTYELALLSKAFSMQQEFDIYHVNIGNGDSVLPFAPFVNKPILVTMHGSFLEENYNKKYLALFNNLKNVYFVSLSSAQRLPLPHLNYTSTIPHGIDTKRNWKFNAIGGTHMVWAGRAIKEKGINELPIIAKKAKRTLNVFPMVKQESPKWIKDLVEHRRRPMAFFTVNEPVNRHELGEKYQKSKVLLFPIQWEEPFGFVLIESMASGTPVIAYARGSVPEIIEDGVTGFIINPSPNEKKGDYIIKKTGIDGFVEAIERIYAMPDDAYHAMRRACRQKVEASFTVQNMIKRYIETYKKVLVDWKKKQVAFRSKVR